MSAKRALLHARLANVDAVGLLVAANIEDADRDEGTEATATSNSTSARPSCALVRDAEKLAAEEPGQPRNQIVVVTAQSGPTADYVPPLHDDGDRAACNRDLTVTVGQIRCKIIQPGAQIVIPAPGVSVAPQSEITGAASPIEMA